MRLEQAKREYYRRRAKEEGYRSRAAFKLKQMNGKYHFIREGDVVVDLGAAPGGWLEVSSQLTGARGSVIGVDLVPIKDLHIKNVRTIEDDIASPGFTLRLKDAIGKGKVDCILADLSPKLSGIWDMDHFRQIDLCHRVIDLLPEILVNGGSCILKAFQGDELQGLVRRLRSCFSRVEISKPDASRKESSEVYLVSTRFNGTMALRQDASQLNGERVEEQEIEHPSDSSMS